MRYAKPCAFGAVVLSLAVCTLAVRSAEPPKSGSSVRAPVVRADQIAGMTVKNPAGQDLGKVEDVVIDIGTGKVRYAAIAFGGFLGVGDKLFAVPFDSLKFVTNANDKSHHFEANIDKKMLEKATGFDKKNWPDFGDPRFSEENDRHYHIVPRT